jgi:hypothetical protein
MTRSLPFAVTVLVVSSLIALSPHRAYGDTIWTYKGNPFTAATAPYSTSDFLTITIDLSSPLLSGTTQTVNPVSFVFSDGVQTLTQSKFAPTFRFTTDPFGDITSWFVSAALMPTQPSYAGGEVDIVLCRPTPILCYSYYDRVWLYNSSGMLVGNGQNLLSAGTWTDPVPGPTTSTPVPEPATLTMLTSVLAGLGLYSRRRRAVRT